MTDTISLSWPLIAGGFMVTVLAPLFMALMTTIQMRRGKREDVAAAKAAQDANWAREDQLEERSIARQKVISDQAAEAARLLLESNRQVAMRADELNTKIGVVHALVNSAMTSQIQTEYDGVTRELILLNLLVDGDAKAGREPSQEFVAALGAAKAKIAELRVLLDERHRQAAVIEKQADNTAAALATVSTIASAAGSIAAAAIATSGPAP